MSITTKQATQDLFDLARRVPFSIAPERAEELAREIFASDKWSITPEEGKANFSAHPETATIYLRFAGLASLWCLSYAAFHIMDAASRYRRSTIQDISKPIDISEYASTINIGEYLAYARVLFKADCHWPDNLSTPNAQADFSSIEGRINNIFFGALSWIMLHEIGHVHHKHEELVPAGVSIRQEYQADSFATTWVLEEAGDGLNREFRVLMISVALTWLFLHESVMGQGTTHPAAYLRFREAADHFKVGR